MGSRLLVIGANKARKKKLLSLDISMLSSGNFHHPIDCHLMSLNFKIYVVDTLNNSCNNNQNEIISDTAA